MVRFVFLFFTIMLPAIVMAQDSTYYIKGTILVGIRFPIVNIELRNADDKFLGTTTSAGLQGFRFKNLSNGNYKLVNKKYNISSPFTIKNQSINSFDITVNGCEVNSEVAQEDIKNNTLKLLLAGGIAPVYYEGQEKFEKKFNINYYEYGCTPPEMKCLRGYNKETFKHLDKKYGKRWRKEVRPDVIGL
ncbi:MAG: carboxypeptidase regulatory-like domain-containing protein [Sphingobacteriaceae bacterium]|nr:MAG: carboxypeptidase regulatory-like domain-containing protein [Sphingobacteriaceae bacterium]